MKYELQLDFLKDAVEVRPNINTPEKNTISIAKDTTESSGFGAKTWYYKRAVLKY